jgi:hypothetical protein
MQLKNLLKYMAVFLAGAAGGAFLWTGQHRSNATPIRVPICFLMQNKDLFDHRQILTTGHLMADLHGESLSDDKCPNGVLTFSSSQSNPSGDASRALASQVTASLGSHGYADIPITFVGTMRGQSKMKALAEWTRTVLFRRPARRPPDLTIDEIVAVSDSADRNYHQ